MPNTAIKKKTMPPRPTLSTKNSYKKTYSLGEN